MYWDIFCNIQLQFFSQMLDADLHNPITKLSVIKPSTLVCKTVLTHIFTSITNRSVLTYIVFVNTQLRITLNELRRLLLPVPLVIL